MKNYSFGFDHVHNINKLIIQSPWNQKLEDYIINNNIDAICFNRVYGWRGENLNFLHKLKHLKCIEILDREIKDVSALNQLKNIEILDIFTECKVVIDFTRFTNLKRCSLIWQKGYESIFESKKLEFLNLTYCSEKTLIKIFKLNTLKRLRLFRSIVENLNGIEILTNIEELELIDCKKIRKLDSVGNLGKLESLKIQRCKKITDLAFIQYL